MEILNKKMPTHNATIIDTVKVLLANITAITFGFIQLDGMRDDIEWWLKIISLLLAILYTAWKWRADIKRNKKN